MLHAFSNRAPGRWLIGGALAILSVLGLTLYLFADDPRAETAGQVQIVAASPMPAPAPSTAEPRAKMSPIPIQLTPANREKVDEQAALQQEETRDAEWATRSEAAILNFTRGIPYLGGGNRNVTVNCKTSVCEINGIVEPDPATGTMKPVWEALERGTASSELRAYGLERTAAMFDTGRSGDEFNIYYRRVAPEPEPGD